MSYLKVDNILNKLNQIKDLNNDEQFMKIYINCDMNNLINISSFLINDKGILFINNNNKPTFNIYEIIHILELNKHMNRDVYIFYGNKYNKINNVFIDLYNNKSIIVFKI